MTSYISNFNPNKTSQTEKAKASQVQNNAGGFVFAINKWQMLERFCILGSEGNTYYATEQKMVRDNAKNVLACLAEDGIKTVNKIVEISVAGRAPKNDPALFALALASADDNAETRKAALTALPQVARIGTFLFSYVDAVSQLRGWGRGLKQAVAKWYTEKSPDDLAMQVLKYQQRNKWSHKDLLRLSHGTGVTVSPEHAAIFEWVRAGDTGFTSREVKRKNSDNRVDKYKATDKSKLPAILNAYVEMKAATSENEVVKLIEKYGFTREMVPTQHLNSVKVWEALLEKMPMTAMIRNLSKMTAIGMLKPLSSASNKVIANLANTNALKKARIHPIQALSALKVYGQGHGERGKLTWTPDQRIVDALNDAFYATFDLIEPTGKNILLALDVSGSMDGGVIAGVPGLTPRMASAAMAMVTARSEKNWHIIGFTAGNHGYDGRRGGDASGVTEIKISPKQRLDDVIKTVSALPMGGTDCALPMIWAEKQKIDVDCFQVYTDNETWNNPTIHPFQALKQYRKSSGRQAKLAVVGLTATDFSIADPSDAGMLDFVGFDSAAPSVISDFIRQ